MAGLSSSSSLQPWRLHVFPFFSFLFILFLFLFFHEALGYCQEFMHSVPFIPKQLDGNVSRAKSNSWWQYHNRRIKRLFWKCSPLSYFFITSVDKLHSKFPEDRFTKYASRKRGNWEVNFGVMESPALQIRCMWDYQTIFSIKLDVRCSVYYWWTKRLTVRKVQFPRNKTIFMLNWQIPLLRKEKPKVKGNGMYKIWNIIFKLRGFFEVWL